MKEQVLVNEVGGPQLTRAKANDYFVKDEDEYILDERESLSQFSNRCKLSLVFTEVKHSSLLSLTDKAVKGLTDPSTYQTLDPRKWVDKAGDWMSGMKKPGDAGAQPETSRQD